VPGVDAATVREWFGADVAVEHYRRAAVNVGLWRAEEALFAQVFRPQDRLLDAGCGAGRIALALWRSGYQQVRGVDFCRPLVETARELASAMGVRVEFEHADVRLLRWDAGSFEGVIFGFNGLMQIPGRTERRRALQELRRVIRSGGRFVFTTHDRELPAEQGWWREESIRWQGGRQDPQLIEFGDRILERPEGRIFMHLPDRAEVREDLDATGWILEFDRLRSQIANEAPAVREFADECRFWVARAG
jgi:SAM-dependent methyltransferase